MHKYDELAKKIDILQDSLNEIRALLQEYCPYEEIDVEKKGKEGVIDFIKKNISLEDFELPEEYSYSCLPLCLMDAIYSIGVRYITTKDVVKRYCEYYNLERICDTCALEEFHTLSNLIENIEKIGSEETRFNEFAEKIVRNKQRTSTKNGCLKIEAVYESAKVLKNAGIETITDFNKKMNPYIEKEYCQVKGQSSGISLAYLKMLCGRTDTIKPDRHIIRFLNKFYDKEVQIEDAQEIMKEIMQELNLEYKALTLRELDYLIWQFMSGK